MVTKFIIGLGGLSLALALVAAPVDWTGQSEDSGSKAAFAKPGNGGGQGNGKGRGAERSAKDGSGAAGAQGGSPGKGKAHGHSKKDAVSGLDSAAPGSSNPGKSKKAAYDGIAGGKVKGSFNAAHASTRAMEVASVNSRVRKVRNYLDAIETVSALENGEEAEAGEESADGEDQAAVDETSLDSAIQAAAEAAAEASNHSVTAGMLEAVNGLGGVEVSEPTNQEVADRAADIQAGGDGSGSETAEGSQDGEGEDGL